MIVVHSTERFGQSSFSSFISQNSHSSDEGDYRQCALSVVNANANFAIRYFSQETSVIKLLGGENLTTILRVLCPKYFITGI